MQAETGGNDKYYFKISTNLEIDSNNLAHNSNYILT